MQGQIVTGPEQIEGMRVVAGHKISENVSTPDVIASFLEKGYNVVVGETYVDAYAASNKK